MKSIITRLILSTALWFSILISHNNANLKAYFPPKLESSYPRMKVKGSLPNMNELTICHWVKPFVSKHMFVVSYAIEGMDNELITGLDTTGHSMSLYIKQKAVQTPFSDVHKIKLGEWIHLCYTWSSGGDFIGFYRNGVKTQSVPNAAKGMEILPGGSLIIGQEQDGFNDKFDVNQSWEGYVYDVQIWDEVLDDDTILDIAKCRVKADGNLFSWMKTGFTAIDGIGFQTTRLCSKKHEKPNAYHSEIDTNYAV